MLQGQIESLQGPSDVSEEARGHFLLRFSNATDGGWQCKVDLSATMVIVPSKGTNHIGGYSHVKRLEDVYAKLGLYEAHIKDM